MMSFKKMKKGEMPVKGMPANNRKPLWDLYTHGLTQGAIHVFLECREQFRLMYPFGLSAKGFSTPLEFGGAFHDCLAQMQTGRKPKVRTAMDNYRKARLTERNIVGREYDDFQILTSQCEFILDAYKEIYKEDEQRDWVCREKVFKVMFPNPIPGLPDIPLTGRWDGLFNQTERSKQAFRLHESKTKGRIDEEGIKDTLHVDTQTMLYNYAAEKTYGRQPTGVIYDVIRRPALRQSMKEDIPQFLERTKKDIAARPKEYFMRWNVNLEKGDLEKFVQQQLTPIVTQIVLWWEAVKGRLNDPWGLPEHYISEKHLIGTYGRCPMFHLITKGNAFNIYRRKHPFPELID